MSRIKLSTEKVVLIADLVGMSVFAAEGALSAISAHFNLMGVMAIAFITALGGGIIRDLLLGVAPPAALTDRRYASLTFVIGLLTFIFFTLLQKIPTDLILLIDAAGLSFFVVAGVEKAILFRVWPFVAVLLGTVTGVGGGVIRDLLLGRAPLALQTDNYASSVFFAAAVVLIGRRLGLSDGAAGLIGGLTCFTLRLVAILFGWHSLKI